MLDEVDGILALCVAATASFGIVVHLASRTFQDDAAISARPSRASLNRGAALPEKPHYAEEDAEPQSAREHSHQSN